MKTARISQDTLHEDCKHNLNFLLTQNILVKFFYRTVQECVRFSPLILCKVLDFNFIPAFSEFWYSSHNFVINILGRFARRIAVVTSFFFITASPSLFRTEILSSFSFTGTLYAMTSFPPFVDFHQLLKWFHLGRNHHLQHYLLVLLPCFRAHFRAFHFRAFHCRAYVSDPYFL